MLVAELSTFEKEALLEVDEPAPELENSAAGRAMVSLSSPSLTELESLRVVG